MKTGQEADLISRTSLLKWIEEDKGDMLMKEHYAEYIKSMPNVTKLYQVGRVTYTEMWDGCMTIIGTYASEEVAEEVAYALNLEKGDARCNYVVYDITLKGDM